METTKSSPAIPGQGGSADDSLADDSLADDSLADDSLADDSLGTGASFLRGVARAEVELPAHEPERIGTRVGRYTIGAELGAGGMGTVYRARDEKLARDVALKLLRRRGDSETQRRRFLREAKAASAVRHANVAAVYEIGEDGGDVFIAMELVPGRSLRSLVDEGPLPPEEARRVAIEIARALAAAHAAGVVHRDLKPDNVMIEPSGAVRVLDFGLAHWSQPETDATPRSETLTAEGHILGTPGYMSPEQVRGDAIDARSDLFSLGVVLYELLTGERPFAGRTKMDVLVATSRDPAPPLRGPRVPRSLSRLVAQLLEKDPAARPATIDAVLAALSGPEPRAVPRAVVLGAAGVGVAAALVVALGSGLGAAPAPPAREQAPPATAEEPPPSAARLAETSPPAPASPTGSAPSGTTAAPTQEEPRREPDAAASARRAAPARSASASPSALPSARPRRDPLVDQK